MSILGNIVSAVLALLEGPMSQAELEKSLDKKAAANPEKLDWRNSIVDLMKLVGMDSSLSVREGLAVELGYTGLPDGSAEMNQFLHARVMEQIAKAR